MNDELAATCEPKSELEQLREEVAFLKTCGVIELAIRNPNVQSYMAHWERRAESAEMTLEHIFGVKMAAEE